jgi:hypothetical protein
MRYFLIAFMFLLVGVTAADANGLIFQDSVLFRDKRTEVVSRPVPSTAEAMSVRGRVTGEVIRAISFMALGNASIHVTGMEGLAGVLLDDSMGDFEIVVQGGALPIDVSLGPLPPGASMVFVTIDTYDDVNVRADREVLDILASQSPRWVALVNGGSTTISGNGSFASRLCLHHTARLEIEVFD